MKVAVVHQDVDSKGPADEQDVLVQAQSVASALETIGHRTRIFPCSLDLGWIRQALIGFGPDAVFNLVESIDGSSRLLPVFPALLERIGFAYTGSCTAALATTTQKVWAKERLFASGIATPAWIGPVPAEPPLFAGHSPPEDAAFRTWIVKSLWEHASFGMTGDVLVSDAGPAALLDTLARRVPAMAGACFAEVFIDGREFNLSILEVEGKPMALPQSEIVFEGYGKDRARIVDYRAKWEADSYEYRHTPRRFEFPEKDRPLLRRLEVLALRCWDLFGLSGYARVDFRVDAQGRPWVLEINANPCLSPDAGFAAALQEAGMPFQAAVSHILDAAVRSTMKNPKHEIRNSKQIQMTKIQMTKTPSAVNAAAQQSP
ncbi:MAG: D-alanine--D-alanine ligase [Desulfobacterales bacterium]|nr:D-alanine--D-alanine ligase [Desulfobacterales bacterium]